MKKKRKIVRLKSKIIKSKMNQGGGVAWLFPKPKTNFSSPCVSRAVKFFAFCHPELAKDLLQQREILAGDASLPLSMTVRLFSMTEWFTEVTKATKGQKVKNLTALPCKGVLEGVVQSFNLKFKI